MSSAGSGGSGMGRARQGLLDPKRVRKQGVATQKAAKKQRLCRKKLNMGSTGNKMKE